MTSLKKQKMYLSTQYVNNQNKKKYVHTEKKKKIALNQ